MAEHVDIAAIRHGYERRVVRRARGCWSWRGRTTRIGGYGTFTYYCSRDKQRKHIRAHRASFLLANGHLPSRADIMHLCHNRTCTNPTHLEAGTRTANLRMTVDAGRKQKKIPMADMPFLMQRLANGEAYDAIGREYGCTGVAVRHMAMKHGPKFGPPPSPRKPIRRLTDEDFQNIRQRRDAGESFASIGKSYGCNHSCVRGFLLRRR